MTPHDLLALDPADHVSDARRIHTDLDALGNPDLVRELSWLRLLNHLTDSSWHREREFRVAAELAARREARRAAYRR
ncbi:MAG: hypothetical protein ACYDB4_17805 [Candidatus Dormibacteraceae bacterium]